MPNEVVAGLLVSIDGNTVKLRTELDRAKASAREAGREMKESMTEAKAGIKQVGEEIGINLNRHLAGFLAKLPGVAPLMAAAFPAAAIVGIGMAFGESINKLVEWVKKGREAAGVINEGFETMLQSSKLANDEQAVTNDRLDAEIAKLTGKHPNTLKTELDEARVEADKLWKSLEADSKAADELIKRGEISSLKGVFTGQAGTEDTRKLIQNQGKELAEIAERYQERIDAATTAAQKEKIQTEQRLELLEKEKQQLADIRGLHGQIKRDIATPGAPLYGGLNQDAVLAILEGRGRELQQMMRSQRQTFEGSDKGDEIKHLKGSADAAKKAQEARGEMVSEMVKDNEIVLKEHDRILEEINAYGSKDLAARGENDKRSWEEQTRESAAYYRDLEKRGQEAAERQQNLRASATASYSSLTDTTKGQVDLGQISEGTRLSILKLGLDEEHRLKVESFNQELDIYNEGTKEYLRVLGERQKADADYFKERADLERQSVQTGLGGAFIDFEKKTTDWVGIFKRELDSSINSVNDELVKLMTTQYRRGDWKAATKPIFTGLAKTGLEGAEGSLMKAFGLGGAGKLGSRGNPMWTKSADGLPGAAGVGSLFAQGGAAGGGSAAAGGVSGFLGVLSGAAKFLGFMESGGVMNPGGFYLAGERGTELLQVGSTSRIYNAGDTSKMLGSGGDVHHHWNIDARGATDPAAIDQAAHRAVEKLAPQIGAMTIRAGREMDDRKPRYRS
jgi:hypothetical protein